MFLKYSIYFLDTCIDKSGIIKQAIASSLPICNLYLDYNKVLQIIGNISCHDFVYSTSLFQSVATILCAVFSIYYALEKTHVKYDMIVVLLKN